MDDLHFVWLEITGKCSLLCQHCYADSGPGGTHGTMDVTDWRRVIGETARLGGRMVQFIGGEPTLHPALPDLIGYALAHGLRVEVFSNLTHVTPDLWKMFAQRGVRLATSYYSDIIREHESITRGRGSYARTRANIAEAVHRSIPLRVGLIEVLDGQRVGQARAELESLGVTSIGVDRLRQVGRGVHGQRPDTSQLCAGRTMTETHNELKRAAIPREGEEKCEPESKCHPAENDCEPHCPPGYHSDPKKCWPYYYADDK